MIQGIKKRSKNQGKSNHNIQKFNDLENLLSNENLLIQSYGNIQRNKRTLTLGRKPETLDEMNLKKIQEISKERKTGTFWLNRLRRKMGGKQKFEKPEEKKT